MNFRIKLDKNDILFSKIIRSGKTLCDRCEKTRNLQAAHIFGRRHYTTRFALYPKPNAVALCAFCHKWFDVQKKESLIFDEKKRVFNAEEDSFTFLVEKLGYTWKDLQVLKIRSQGSLYPPYSGQKEEIYAELKMEFKKMGGK